MKFVNNPIKYLIIFLILIANISTKSYSQTFVNFKQRLQNGGINLKGDITFIANSTVSKNQDGTVPNDNYNGSESNNRLNLDYIDVDNDPTTFSSSKAQLNLPSCSSVVFAGMYWSAVYPRKYWNDVNSVRDTEVNTIKFKLPNQSYQDITGDVIFDGPTIVGTQEKIVYTCFKDVTDIINTQNDPNGDYFAANIKATVRGRSNTGSSAGWILVVIYENETEPARRVSIFDGFTAVKGGSNSVNAEVSYTGFKTIPNGPVRAKLLVAALEGDKSIRGDRFQFKDVNGTLQSLRTPNTNPETNFFNGSITIDDQYLPNRNPASENTLGFDADLFELNNINNQLIANNQESADIKLTTSGDGYWVFLNAMSVEIIEPDIELIKTIEDINGNDIAGQDVTLGDQIWYNVSFRNKGNDDATATKIVDRLPKNVDLLETELIVPNGVTYTYDPPTLANQFRGELQFTIPNNLVEKGDPKYDIRIKVKVVETCNELRDVCSYIIQNQAFADYSGTINGVTVTNTPSYFGVDNCNRGFVGPSNFLADIENCTYEREEVLCTDTVDLTAGAGFLSYEWKNAAGDVIGTTQTITVDRVGRYTVDKVAPVGCIGSQEIINVVSFITQPNPIIPFADEVKTCPDDGSELSEIYLCGTGSSRTIETSIFNSNTIIWQKLDETSCADNNDANCPNTSNDCTWNTLKTGNDFEITNPGKYRVEIRAQGGCFKRYYFNSFQATLDPLIDKTDLVCGNNGNITVNNVPDGYQYSLTNDINTFQDSNSFDINTAGTYTVYIRRKDAAATSCVYSIPNIDVFEKNIEVDLITTPIQCSDDNGSIRVQVNNVTGDYIYELYKDNLLLSKTSPKSDNDHTFSISDGGTYTVKVTAPNNCSFEGQVTISKPDPINISAVTTKNISCTNGIIDLFITGGTPIYNYAIWSYNGVEMYNSPTTIPIIEFFTNSSVEIGPGKEGEYRFVVVDNNNCYRISDPVTIVQEPSFTFTENINNVSCNLGSNGSVELTLNEDRSNYSLNYSIDNGTNYQTENLFSNLSAGNYKILIRATKNLDTCNYEKDIVITEPSTINGSATLTQDYTCKNDGTITFSNSTGGTPPYKYSLDGVNFFDGLIFDNLTAGNYEPQIKDANNCIITLPNITIQNLPIQPSFSTTIDYNCDGSGNLEILPFDSSYTYSLNGGITSNSNTFSNLSAGNYSVDINIGQECIETLNVTILGNNNFNGSIVNHQNITCFGDNDGSISISAENFDSFYQYSINNGVWINSNNANTTISNLAAGTYNIKIRKDTCTEDLGDVVISEPNPIVVSATINSAVSCVNSDASITTSATGGNPPYQFSIDNGTTWFDNLPNLSVGNYTIQARDSKGCISSTNANLIIDGYNTLSFVTNATNCFNGNNGQIQVDVTNGNTNYVFSINDGPWQNPNFVSPSTFTFTNLQPNTYKISVKDQLSCEVSEENIIINPQLLASISTKDINCNDGEISINPNGGDSNYIYAVIPSSNSISPTDFSSNNIFTIQNQGNYTVYVRDKNGGANYCEFIETVTINKTPDLDILATPTQPKCFNETGSIAFALSGGEKPYTVNITNPQGFNETVPNIFNDEQSFYNLIPENYTITLTDANNCSKQIISSIINPTELDATINPILPSCGVTDVSQFGIQFNLSNSYTPYSVQYSIDNGISWSTNSTFMNIASGTILNPILRLMETDNVTVRCQKQLDNFRMPFHVSNLIVSSSASGDCKDGFNVTVEAKDGVAPYEFAINSTTNWQSPAIANASTFVFDNLTPGLTYRFYVKDATGCIKENSVDVYDSFTPDINITGTVNQNACFSSDTGEITFSIDDSISPLTGTINWQLFDANTNAVINNGSQNNTNDIQVSNLPAGEYYLSITNNLCSWGSRNITINRGSDINGTLNLASDISCNSSGIINIDNVTGGFGNYTFTLSSANFINPIVTLNTSVEIPISNLVDDTISSSINVLVTDGSNCFKNLGDITINVSDKPIIQSFTSDSCDTNKTISIIAGNGLAPYFYSIDNGITYQNDGNFKNLTAGNYTLKVKDSNGCESPIENVTIYPSLNFESTLIKNLDCTTNPDATVEINIISGSNDYDIEIKNSSNNTVISRTKLASNTETFSLLNPDTYYLTVYDNITNCAKTIPVTIQDKQLPTFTYTAENSTCFGSNAGKITLSNSNSSLNYSYAISPISGSFDTNSNSFINLEPNTYTITATANNSCSVIASNIVISEFNSIVVPQPIVTDFSCSVGNTTNNASISIDTSNITGGSGNYINYEFINNQGTSDLSDDVVVQTGLSSEYILNDIKGGNFTITIYDDSGCQGSINTTINPFIPITSVTIQEDKTIDCNSGSNISIITNTELQTANKIFSINGNSGFSDSNSTGIFTNLSANNYTIRVTNLDTNCFLETTYEVDNPNNFSIQVNKINDVSCLGSNSGTINFQFDSSTPYTGDYYYQIMEKSTDLPTTIDGNSNGITQLNTIPEGEYYIKAIQSDNPFCEVLSNPFTIEAPSSDLDFNFTSTPINCENTSSGNLIVNAFGGWQEYEYKISTVSGTIIQNFDSNNSFENLSADDYVLAVRDKLGCLVEKTVTLSNPQEILGNPIITSSLVCNNSSDAAITITNVSGGQGNPATYYYQIQKENEGISAKQTSNVFSGLSAGNYQITISDEYSCSKVYDVSIANPTIVEVSASIVNNISCLQNEATVSLSATGGAGNYTFSKDGINFVNSNTFDVTPGEHQFYARDMNGCTSNVSTIITIDPLIPLSATLNTSSSEINCASESNAVLSADATGGFGNYEYELLNEVDAILQAKQRDNTFSNLAAGTYKIKVYSADCEYITESHTITEPNPLVFTSQTSVTDISCFGNNDGSIVINAAGGSGSLVYSIDQIKFESNNIFTNLSAGTYDVIVQDEKGCFITDSVTINEPDALSVTAINVQQELCLGENNASFELNITGGNPPYKTSLNGAQYVEDKLAYDNLEGGKTYVVFVTDAKGCESFIAIPFDAPVNLELNISSTINCSNSLSTITATVDDVIRNEVQFSLDDINYTSTSVFNDIQTGNYTVYAKHNNGCVDSKNITINNPDPLNITSIDHENILCNGSNNGRIVVNTTGGFGVLSYSLDGVNYQPNNIFENLSGGNYTVSIKDELNCSITSAEITIDEPEELKVSLKSTTEITCISDVNGSFEIEIEGGKAPYMVKIDNEDFVENKFTFNNLEGGKNYTISVRDANNCSTQLNVNLNQGIDLDLSLIPEYTCHENATIFAIVNDAYESETTYTINGSNQQTDGFFTDLKKGDYTIVATHKNGCSVSKTISIDETTKMDFTVDTSTENKLIVEATGGIPPYSYSLDDINYTDNNIFDITETKIYTIYVKDQRGCLITKSILGEYIDIEIPNFFTPNGNGKHDCWYPEKVKNYHNIEVQIYDRYSRLLKVFKGVDNCWDGNYNNRPLPSGDYWYVMSSPKIRLQVKK